MSNRLYFVVPSVQVAQQIERELLLARVDSSRMHFMSSDNVDLRGLPQATFAQRTDIVHGLQVGIPVGGIVGFLTGFMALAAFGVSSELATAVGGLTMFGAVFGAWVAAMIGSDIPNSRLKGFEKDLDEGHVLLMVDVPRSRVPEVREMVKKHHPETDYGGVEPSIPAFP